MLCTVFFIDCNPDSVSVLGIDKCGSKLPEVLVLEVAVAKRAAGNCLYGVGTTAVDLHVYDKISGRFKRVHVKFAQSGNSQPCAKDNTRADMPVKFFCFPEQYVKFVCFCHRNRYPAVIGQSM